MRKLIAALLLCAAGPAFGQGLTIDALGSAATLTGSELIPMFQTANPAVSSSVTNVASILLGLNNAWTGNESHSGTEIFTSTSLAAQAAGQFQAAGIATAPSLTTTGGQGLAFITAAGGMNIQGFGSTSDVQVLNKSGTLSWSIPTGSTGLTVAGNILTANAITAGAASAIGWTGRGSFSSLATASITIGAGDVASPAAQTLRVPSVVTGTSNGNGANWSINGSASTGTGVSGDVILQTGGTGAASTTQNSQVAGLTVKGATQLVVLNQVYTVSTLPAGVTRGITFVSDQATSCPAPGAALTGSGAVLCPVFYNGSAWVSL